MPFSEKIKEEVLRKANFRCCLCRSHPATNVHHITPQKDGGPDTEDNAAPLCPNCHDTYGGNPDKRKSITRNRDDWYELCQNFYTPNNKLNQEILEHVRELATKEDLDNAVKYISGTLSHIVEQPTTPTIKMQQISDATAAISVATTSDSITSFDAYGGDINNHVCQKCGFSSHWNYKKCPQCGHPKE